MASVVIYLHREPVCKLLAFGDILVSNISIVNRGLESDTQMQKVGIASAPAFHLGQGLLQYNVINVYECGHEMLDKVLVNISRLPVIGLTQATQNTFIATLILIS